MTGVGLDERVRALAHPDRRAFLRACREGPLSAGDLVVLSALSGATVSEHLRVLRKTGLLILERRGKNWLYRTDSELVAATISELRAAAGSA